MSHLTSSTYVSLYKYLRTNLVVELFLLIILINLSAVISSPHNSSPQTMSDTPDHGAEEESATPVQPAPAPTAPVTPVSKEPEPPARFSSWRAFRDPLLIGILITALVVDQITKQLVLNNLGIGASWPDDGFFRFTFVRNDGTAFGLFQDNGTLLTFVSIGAVALIVYFYREAVMVSWFTRTALGLQLGGALGNLVDRFRHGYVVDFLDVGRWPIFESS